MTDDDLARDLVAFRQARPDWHDIPDTAVAGTFGFALFRLERRAREAQELGGAVVEDLAALRRRVDARRDAAIVRHFTRDAPPQENDDV